MKQLKRNGKRMLALFLAMVMCLSMVQLTAFAADPTPTTSVGQIEGETSPVYYTWRNGKFSETGDTGSEVTNRETDPNVKISKVISSTDTENVFDITLNVETTERIEPKVSSPDAAVVLVFDVSNSMTYSLNNSTRLAVAQEKAKAFITNFATDAKGGKRLVSLVTFGTNGQIVPLGDSGAKWVDVTTTDGMKALNSAIDHLRQDWNNSWHGGWWSNWSDKDERGGTNIEAGLQLADNLYNHFATPDVQQTPNRFSILLTDGSPTYKGTSTSWGVPVEQADTVKANGGNGQNDNYGLNASAATRAAKDLLKVDGIKSYAICFASNTQNWMKTSGDDKTFDLVKDAQTANELNQQFDKITQLMKLEIDAWKVIDPMGKNIEYKAYTGEHSDVVCKDGELTWDLRKDLKSGNVKFFEGDNELTDFNVDNYKDTDKNITLKYSLTYRIHLNNLGSDFESGKYYQTNGRTYLNYFLKDANGNPIDDHDKPYEKDVPLTLDFKVPAVKGYLAELSFTKVDPEGTALNGAVFTLTSKEGNIIRTATSDPNGDVTFAKIPSGYTYTLKETQVPTASDRVYQAVADSDVTVSYGNLTYNSEVINDGNVVDPYTVTTRDVTITKKWEKPATEDAPESIKVTLFADGTPVEGCTDFVINKPNGDGDTWTHTFTGLPVKNAAGKVIVYTVTEKEMPGWKTTYGSDGLSIINTRTSNGTLTIQAQKTWVLPNNDQPKVTFKLIQNDKVIDSKELTGNGNVLFSNLPIYDGNGQLYTYDVTEEMGAGYSQSARTVEGVSNFRNYVFTNTVADEKIAEISGTKTWNDGDGTGRPESITINLLADGTKVDSKVVTAENNWQYSFTNLPRYAFTKDANGTVTDVREIKYTLEEVSVDGYKSDVTGYNVTNTRTGEVDLTVYKNWVDVTGTEHDDVTVKVSGNGKSWQETFKGHAIFEDLPKYDQFGNEIDYVVEELDVPEGYTSSVSYDWANNVVTVTNTRNDLDGRVNISVNKAWRQPGGEPDQTATFDLYADGEYMESRTITGNGSAIFDDLPRYTEDVEEPAIPAPVVPLPDDTVTPDDPAVGEDNTVTPDDPAAGEDDTVTPDDPAAGEDDTVTPDDPAAGGDDTVTPDDPAAGEDDTVTPDDPAAGEDSTVTPDDPAAGEDNTVTPGDSAEVEGSEAVPDMSILFAAPQVASLNEVADTYESPAVSAPANVYAREIEYTVKEVVPNSYISTETHSSDDDGNVTYNFVNTITGITSVTVNKHWVKPENVAASEVTFKVYRGLGIENEEKTEVGTITISAGESTATLPNLPKYTEDGVRYLYTVEEASVLGYSSKTVGGIQADGSFVFDVTNTINPADITIPVTKVWVDGNKPNSERPEVTIWLLQGNEVPSGWGGSDYKSVTFKSDADGNVTAETATMVNGVLIPDEEAPIVTVNGNEWTCNVKVPQYSEDGTLKFEYQAREYDVPAGYAKTESGYTVTNKASGVTGIEISKMWTAPEGTAFPEIELTLSGSDGSSYTIIANSDGATMGGEALVFASTGTTWTFTAAGLPEFDSDGAKIDYTLSEKPVEGYTQAEPDEKHPYWIRNVINQEKIEVTAEKVWANMDASGYLNASYPANITVALFRGDEMVEGTQQTVANLDNTFPIESYTDLDKYDLTTGQEYKYSVRELDAEDNAVAEGGVITFAADNSYRVSYVTEGNNTVITNTYQTSGEYFYQIRTHYVHYDADGNVISRHEILRGSVVRLPEPQTVNANSADYVVNSVDNLTYAFDSGNTSNVLTVDVQNKNELYTMELYYVLRDTAPTPEPPEETDPPETDPPEEPDDPYYPPEPDDPYTPPTVEVPEVTIPDEDVPMAEVPEEVFPDVEVPQEEIPEVVIPDEDVPLAEIPEVIIPDEDVPLAEIPEVIIPDEDVPLAEVPEEPIPEIEIPEPDVPLADVPKTGENTLWTILALTSGLGLVWLALDSKKRREEA